MTDSRRDIGMRVAHELIRMLPPEGEEFPVHERLQWLQAMEATLQLTYGIEGQVTFTVVEPTPPPNDGETDAEG